MSDSRQTNRMSAVNQIPRLSDVPRGHQNRSRFVTLTGREYDGKDIAMFVR